MKKIKVIIVDDEPDAIEILTNLLSEFGSVEVVECISNPVYVESKINKHKPDVLFLDIDMPGIDGIEILRNLREYNSEINIVYVTAYEKYMADAITMNVFSYLLKPIKRSDLKKTIEQLERKVLSGIDNNNYGDKVKLPVKKGYVLLKLTEILFMEAKGNYTEINTIDSRTYLSSYNMGFLYRKLPENQFLRINRGCILNSDYLKKIDKQKKQCTAIVNQLEIDFDISNAFLVSFNKIID